MLDPKVWWPLVPLLLLVRVVRRPDRTPAIWFQLAAFTSYLAAAVAAMASERGNASVNLHRPFSISAQASIALAMFYYWRGGRASQIWINGAAQGAILADTALHYHMAR
jgi:hypothetical protein